MPYRLNPKKKNEVQVKRGTKWQKLKVHTSTKDARGHLYQLEKNVKK